MSRAILEAAGLPDIRFLESRVSSVNPAGDWEGVSGGGQKASAGEWSASRRRGLGRQCRNKKRRASLVEKPPLQFPNPIEDRNRLTGTVAASANRPVANGGEAESTWAPDPPPRGSILTDV